MKAPQRQARAVARLAAVQALYQMETAGAGAETVVREFLDHRFDADLEGEQLAQADHEFFAQLVRGAVSSQTEIDRAIAGHLASGWRLERLDATARAIFRAAGFELMRTDAPIEVVIDGAFWTQGAAIDRLFEAVAEATEEAALNALFKAETVTGRDGHVLHALPIDRTLDLLRGWHPI